MILGSVGIYKVYYMHAMQLFNFTSLLELTISWMNFYLKIKYVIRKGMIGLFIGLNFTSTCRMIKINII
jgi:uncharacterized membrane protein